MKIKVREYDSMTNVEKISVYACICNWVGTELTDSVYVLDCKDHFEAERKAHAYFETLNNAFLCKEIKRIDVLPRGCNRWSGQMPVYHKNYVSPLNTHNIYGIESKKRSGKLEPTGKSVLRA